MSIVLFCLLHIFRLLINSFRIDSLFYLLGLCHIFSFILQIPYSYSDSQFEITLCYIDLLTMRLRTKSFLFISCKSARSVGLFSQWKSFSKHNTHIQHTHYTYTQKERKKELENVETKNETENLSCVLNTTRTSLVILFFIHDRLLLSSRICSFVRSFDKM